MIKILKSQAAAKRAKITLKVTLNRTVVTTKKRFLTLEDPSRKRKLVKRRNKRKNFSRACLKMKN
jgi:hypothetical protein